MEARIENGVCDSCELELTSFEFAYYNYNYADRILKILVVPKLLGDDDAGLGSSLNRLKRKRSNDEGSSIEGGASLTSDLLTVFSSAILAAKKTFFLMVRDPSTVCRVVKIPISSAILAAKSTVFRKLFSTAIKESELKIEESDEAVFMDILRFMYYNKLESTSPSALLDCLIVADRFAVTSCVNHCSRLLREITMTTAFALRCVDLPDCVCRTGAVQTLMEYAKQFLVNKFKDISKYKSEILDFPLAGIEALFSSNNLEIFSEDEAYDFMVVWAQKQYPGLKERKEIMSTRLVFLIRFAFMTVERIKELNNCVDMDKDIASKIVVEALCFKLLKLQKPIQREEDSARDTPKRFPNIFVPRVYKLLATKREQ